MYKAVELQEGDLLLRKQNHNVVLLIEEINGDLFTLRVIDKPENNKTYKLDETIQWSKNTIQHFFWYGIIEKMS